MTTSVKIYQIDKGKAGYIRDGRAPIPLEESTSRVMSSIRGKDTTLEINLRRALREAGVVGFSFHLKRLPGRPDIAFKKKKLAIFINGCFWHLCPYCRPTPPKSHKAFWKKKFTANKLRDARKRLELKKMGWNTLTIWECQWKKRPQRQLMRILKALGTSL